MSLRQRLKFRMLRGARVAMSISDSWAERRVALSSYLARGQRVRERRLRFTKRFTKAIQWQGCWAIKTNIGRGC